jgi:DNA polymerase (family X)
MVTGAAVDVSNQFIGDVFAELASLLELSGDGRRARPLRRFTRALNALTTPALVLRAQGGLAELPGASHALPLLDELLSTGALRASERLRLAVPASLLDLLRVPGLRASHIHALRERLGVVSLGDLAAACQSSSVLDVAGFDERTQAGTLAAVRFLLGGAGLFPLYSALCAGETVIRGLRLAGAREAVLAGEARRGVEAVSEVVVVASGLSARQALEALQRLPQARAVKQCGQTLLAELGQAPSRAGGLPVRVRLSGEDERAADLLVETGSAPHMRWLAERARAKGHELASLARTVQTETELYELLDLPFVPPELREGPVASVPTDLVGPRSLRGLFHVHTDWSDGVASIVEMAWAAQRMGCEYVGISDHAGEGNEGGLGARRLREQRDAVRFARREVPGVTILHGCEVDILPDGGLDIEDGALAELDFVIASVHTALHQDPTVMTRRLTRAVSHPLVTMLGHPTGRLLFARRSYGFDLREVSRAASANETYLEINGNAGRLDLGEALVRRAAALGADFVINPDAHDDDALADVELGAQVARRAGLSASRVLNASGRAELLVRLAARRQRGLFSLGLQVA